MSDYSPPLDRLLSLGQIDWGAEDDDYRAMGLGPEHAPDLIRMAGDMQLNLGDPESHEVWAPLHAVRALGQLGAVEAVEPLLALLDRPELQDDDALHEELPRVFAGMGPGALPGLAAGLGDASRGLWSRAAMISAVQQLAHRHPETAREPAVQLLLRQLEQAPTNPPELNGFLIAALLDLKAAEAAPLMERAFAANAVDESIAGDWPYVQYLLGLTDKPPPRRAYVTPVGAGLGWSSATTPRSKAKERAKAKRKQARAARKKNRKGKK